MLEGCGERAVSTPARPTFETCDTDNAVAEGDHCSREEKTMYLQITADL
jgi:hypothetical protein